MTIPSQIEQQARPYRWAPLNMLRKPGSRFLLEYVAAKNQTSVRCFLGKDRFKHIVAMRHEAIRLAYQHTTLSSMQLGRVFGVDHATILYAAGRTSQSKRPRLTRDPLEKFSQARSTEGSRLLLLRAEADGRYREISTVVIHKDGAIGGSIVS